MLFSDSSIAPPPFDEPANSALTIPVVSLSDFNSYSILPDLLAPYLPNIDFTLIVSKSLLSIQVTAFGTEGEEGQFLDNIVTSANSLVVDTDGDGAPDPAQCTAHGGITGLKAMSAYYRLSKEEERTLLKYLQNHAADTGGQGSH